MTVSTASVQATGAGGLDVGSDGVCTTMVGEFSESEGFAQVYVYAVCFRIKMDISNGVLHRSRLDLMSGLMGYAPQWWMSSANRRDLPGFMCMLCGRIKRCPTQEQTDPMPGLMGHRQRWCVSGGYADCSGLEQVIFPMLYASVTCA
jgi:hypothetical protein